MLASGHFSNNQAGQLKVLVVLTSREVVDRQEPITPLRSDEYSTLVKEDQKRKAKQEGTNSSSRRQKRVKQEPQVKQEKSTSETSQASQEIHVKPIKQEESVPTPSYQSPKRNETEDAAKDIVGHGRVVDLSGVDDTRCDLVFAMSDAKGSEGGLDEEDEVDEEDRDEVARFVPEFV
ncbi:hypothetical protein HRG_001345 [Hirsutella rhossiliensis]|uniref:Uncharacterized protein n=1 Tax=Hirsutella rhossiliensis TaxID=111463 RepID=A0A9P8SMK9_9HYPO|nr:uncharacterized protein HRG_01345 [Hirsutella rhossiliensis]KAH0968703.1 hypothetical protein HRG_01345 [Hirsutella rhossiliensis]